MQTEVGWEARKVVILGQQVLQPRRVAYQADDQSLTYTYSRTTLTPDPWSPAVAAIKVEAHLAKTHCCSAEEVHKVFYGPIVAVLLQCCCCCNCGADPGYANFNI